MSRKRKYFNAPIHTYDVPEDGPLGDQRILIYQT